MATSQPTLTWNTAQFKQALKMHLVENGEIAGKFIEADARQRLHKINDPEWGRGYRTQIVSRLLTNQVEALENEVVITVGVATSKSGRHHGFYIELGSSTARAHPFLRPAVFNNGKKIVALLEGK